MKREDIIEVIAASLASNTWGFAPRTWPNFAAIKPGIGAIYRSNAEAVLRGLSDHRLTIEDSGNAATAN